MLYLEVALAAVDLSMLEPRLGKARRGGKAGKKRRKGV